MQSSTNGQQSKLEMRKTRSRTKNSGGAAEEKEGASAAAQQQNSIRGNESDQMIGSPSKSSVQGEVTKQTSSSKITIAKPQKQRSMVVKSLPA